MNLLVLPPRFSPDSISISRAAARRQWLVERLSSWNVPEELRGRGAAVYGEPLFVSVVAEPLGIDVLEPSIDWLPSVPLEYRKRPVVLTTLGEARPVPSRSFIKPVADKCFAARVYASGADLPPTSAVDDAELVLLSEPVMWEVEFRAFVLDRQVVTMSPYLRNGQLVEDSDGGWPADPAEIDAAAAFCRAVLNDPLVESPPAFVLDVGRISDRGWAVIEANAAWGSGLYGCDPEQMLHVVRRACVERGQVRESDRRWLRAS